MTDYPIDMQLLVDPLNPENVVRSGAVYLYDPSDEAGVSPIALKDPSGLPLPNPLTSNAYGFTQPCIVTIPKVKWKSGTFEGFFYSYDGLRNEAIAARAAAEAAQGSAATAATNAAGAVSDALAGAVADAQTAASAAAASADLVGAPADDAIAAAVGGNGKTKTALNATFATVAEMATSFTGVNGYTYGNSWIAYANYSAVQYPLRLPAKLGLAAMNNKANAGYRMQDTAVNAFGTTPTLTAPATAYPWTAGTKGVIVVGDLLNNLIEPDNQRNRDTALESCRALVALLSASAKVEDSAAAFTFTGTWSTLTSDQLSGGSGRYINPNLNDGIESAQYVDIVVPAGVNYLTFWGAEGAASGTRGGTFVIRDGATLLAEVSTDAKAYMTTLRANGGRAPVVYKVPGTAGRTLRITAKPPAGYSGVFYAIIDTMLTQSATPPLVVLVKPVQTLAATHNKPALLTYLRTVPDTVAAEFPNVVVIDPATGWDPATMLGADLLHPNEAGQEFLANKVVAGVKAEMLRRTRATAFGTLV
jgi:hypothetical protein